MNKPSAINRIEEFESLRGLMALWVLFGHVALTFEIAAFDRLWWWRLLESNREAVGVFIILSGFVIFHLLQGKSEPYSSYIYRRFWRLFPAYLVCLLLSIAMLRPSLQALQTLGTPSLHDATRIQIFNDSLDHFWPQLFAHLTMLHGLAPNRLLPSSDYAFVGQAWSISVEWQFYLLAPFGYAMARDRQWRGFILIAAMACVLIFAKRFFGEGFIGAHILYFAIGCASSFLWRSKSEWLERFAKHSNLLIPLITVLLVLLLRHQCKLAIWFCVLASCITLRQGGSDKIIARSISRLLTVPPLRWLGRISYSVYLIHMMALYAMLWLLRASDLSPMNLMLLTLVGTLAITLTTAHLSYRWIELPFIQFARRRRSRKVMIESGIAA